MYSREGKKLTELTVSDKLESFRASKEVISFSWIFTELWTLLFVFCLLLLYWIWYLTVYMHKMFQNPAVCKVRLVEELLLHLLFVILHYVNACNSSCITSDVMDKIFKIILICTGYNMFVWRFFGITINIIYLFIFNICSISKVWVFLPFHLSVQMRRWTIIDRSRTLAQS